MSAQPGHHEPSPMYGAVLTVARDMPPADAKALIVDLGMAGLLLRSEAGRLIEKLGLKSA